MNLDDQIETAVIIERRWDGPSQRYDIFFKTKYVIRTDESITNFTKKIIDVKGEYTPKDGDKLFFLPGCTVPRFKMKKFCEEYGTAMVKYIDKANSIFISLKYFDDVLEYTVPYATPKEEVVKYFNTCKPEIADMIQQSTCGYVFFNSCPDTEMLITTFRSNFNVTPRFSSSPYNDHTYRLSIDSIEKLKQFKDVVSNPNIHNEVCVSKLLNTGAEMTETEYESIKRLITSNDTTNLKVAVEIMANCDFEKSAVYLLLLIHEFGSTMYTCQTTKHVNFKSLMTFFNISGLQYFYLDEVMESLIKTKLVSRNNLNILMPLYEKSISSKLGTKYVKASGINFTKDVKAALEENILDGPCDTDIISDKQEYITPHLV